MNLLLGVVLLLGIWEGNSQGVSFRELTEECRKQTEANVQSLDWFDSVVNILSECGVDEHVGASANDLFCETGHASKDCAEIFESAALQSHCLVLVEAVAGCCCSGDKSRAATSKRLRAKTSNGMGIKISPTALSNGTVRGIRGQQPLGDRRVSDASNSAPTIPDKRGLETYMIIVISIVGALCGMLVYWFVFHEPVTRRKRRQPRPPRSAEKEKLPLVDTSTPPLPDGEDDALSSTVSDEKSSLDNQDKKHPDDKSPPVLKDMPRNTIKRASSWTSNVRTNKVGPAPPIQQAHVHQIDATGFVTPVCAHQIDATGMITPISRKASRGRGGMGDSSDSSKSSEDSGDELDSYDRRHKSLQPNVHDDGNNAGHAILQSTSSVDDFSDEPGTKQRRVESSQQRINIELGVRKDPGTLARLEVPAVSSKGSVDDFSDEPGTTKRHDESSQQRINIESGVRKNPNNLARLEVPAVTSKGSVDDFSDEPGTKQRRDESGQQQASSDAGKQEEDQDRDSSLSPDDDINNDLLDNHADSNHDFTYALPQEYQNCLSPASPADERDAYYGGVYYGEDEPDEGYMLQSRIASPQAEERSETSLYGGVNYGSDDDTENPPMDFVARYDGDDAISQPTYDGFDEWATNSIDSRLSINSRDTILSSEWQRRLRDDQLEPVSERVDQLHPVSEEEAVHNSYTTDSSYIH